MADVIHCPFASVIDTKKSGGDPQKADYQIGIWATTIWDFDEIGNALYRKGIYRIIAVTHVVFDWAQTDLRECDDSEAKPSKYSFDRFWQEDEQVESARPSSAERHCDGEQQQQAAQEVDTQLQPVESQQLHDYSSYEEPPPERIQYAIEWKDLLKTKRIGMDTEQDVSLAPGAFWEESRGSTGQKVLAAGSA
ncbi:hypothetical protein B0A55_11759 [Friedmanniomyces simplex]|uniref:Uncharacterized protein n=1 Tax=Friedmanniomyces simplex TaxID=329884 RepID=A0A4U0WRV1_9PEZI|nr:hypothetical protein B0A55_11759 [Friedmanniomyces simplex]